MTRESWRGIATDDGASLVEYTMAVALIGLAAVLVVGFAGRATSDAFDEVGGAFGTDSAPVLPADGGTSVLFDDLFDSLDDIDGPGKSLTGKAEDAESRYLAGDVDGAVGKLDSLVKEVDVQDGKQLTSDEAAAIRNAAQELIEAIGPG